MYIIYFRTEEVVTTITCAQIARGDNGELLRLPTLVAGREVGLEDRVDLVNVVARVVLFQSMQVTRLKDDDQDRQPRNVKKTRLYFHPFLSFFFSKESIHLDQYITTCMFNLK